MDRRKGPFQFPPARSFLQGGHRRISISPRHQRTQRTSETVLQISVQVPTPAPICCTSLYGPICAGFLRLQRQIHRDFIPFRLSLQETASYALLTHIRR